MLKNFRKIYFLPIITLLIFGSAFIVKIFTYEKLPIDYYSDGMGYHEKKQCPLVYHEPSKAIISQRFEERKKHVAEFMSIYSAPNQYGEIKLKYINCSMSPIYYYLIDILEESESSCLSSDKIFITIIVLENETAIP